MGPKKQLGPLKLPLQRQEIWAAFCRTYTSPISEVLTTQMCFWMDLRVGGWVVGCVIHQSRIFVCLDILPWLLSPEMQRRVCVR